jgi:16S rRNA pseudouridine516 synthase
MGHTLTLTATTKPHRFQNFDMAQKLLLPDLLFSQGFGTRRICAGLVQQGLVQVDIGHGLQIQTQTDLWIGVVNGMSFLVQGILWQYHEKAYVLLHKPAGTECSHKPSAWPSVYSLLPAPLRQRPAKTGLQGVQAVGRLDQDTTGMLLLSDDGQFIHRMSSPKHHVPKVYELTTEDALDEKVVSKLLQGVVLNDDPAPVKAAACSLTGSHTLQLTLTEGKYHQVKRMLAATGHKVVQLHRSRIGDMALTEDLAPGQWRWLSETELSALTRKQAQA